MSFLLKHTMQSPSWVFARLPNALSWTETYFSLWTPGCGTRCRCRSCWSTRCSPPAGCSPGYPTLYPEQTFIFLSELQVAGHVVDVVLVEAHDAVPRLGVRQATQRFILNRNLFFFMNSKLRDTLYMSFLLIHTMQSPGWVFARLPSALSWTKTFFSLWTTGCGTCCRCCSCWSTRCSPPAGCSPGSPALYPEQTLIFLYELQVAGHIVDVVLVEAHDAVPQLGVRQAPQRFILNRHSFFFMNSRLRDTCRCRSCWSTRCSPPAGCSPGSPALYPEQTLIF